jgi:TatD DNase family protein
MADTDMFFDSHCHFDFPEFDEDRMEVWRAAQAAGIKAMVMPGVYPEQWDRLIAIAEKEPGFYWALGIHPCWIHQVAVDSESLRVYAGQIDNYLAVLSASNRQKFIAIGECGLDKTIDTSLPQQMELLRWHIELANRLGKPLIVHSLKTHNELISLCKNHKPQQGGVVHAFSGSYETAMQLIDLGFYLGAGGVITYERAQKTRNTFARVPREAILLETDAPDMPLCGRQGIRNTPQSIPLIAQALADLRGETLAVIAKATFENSCRLFSPLIPSFLNDKEQ